MPHFDRRLLDDPAEVEAREILRAVLGPAGAPPTLTERFGPSDEAPAGRSVDRGPRRRPRSRAASAA